MQISDLVGQYSRNVANGTEELHGAQSVQKLVSTIGDLSAGSIFEGTINSVRGGKVTLALGNGQTITARLDGKMDLQQIFDNTDFVHASGTKEEWIVLTAHYDTTSLSHGAYDNMSGCAGLLGIMEYMKDKERQQHFFQWKLTG